MPLGKNPSLSAEQAARQNHLLTALPAPDHQRLLPHLELLPLVLNAEFGRGRLLPYEIHCPPTTTPWHSG